MRSKEEILKRIDELVNADSMFSNEREVSCGYDFYTFDELDADKLEFNLKLFAEFITGEVFTI